ncbi:MAG: aquaporin Z [Maribacter sp.]
MVPYIIAEIMGGITSGLTLYLIASGKPGFEAGGWVIVKLW